tara:strand:+ start:53 stop:547 length:495 start_codon:yes stop_codon:yes gene_type:complete
MIITCPNCNKKFNLDEKLIPNKGRLLQCSSCNHKWHFSLFKTEETKINKQEIIKKENKKKVINPTSIKTKEKKVNESKIVDSSIKLKSNNKKVDTKKDQNNKKDNSINLINLILVFIISIIALILILDTFKQYLGIYFPILITLMDNLYQSLIDIKSFIKDLIS